MSKMILSLAAVALLQVTLVAAILPLNYQDRSAAEKQTFLWNQLLFDPYTTLPVGGHGPLQMANVVVPTYHTVAFNRPSDEMVTGRKKLLHPYGSCAKADFKIHANSQYTGVFQAGTVGKAIIRPSVAVWHPIGTGLAPGLGVKVLINGQKSQNFHTIYKTEGQGPNNNNFFLNTVSSYFKMPEMSGVNAIALKAMQFALRLLAGGAEARPEGVNNLGLYEQSSVTVDGASVDPATIRAPWKVDFRPNPMLHTPPENTVDFRLQLASLPEGTKVYDILVHPSRESYYADVPGVLIGEVVTTSEFVNSVYCDDGLLLQHASKPWAGLPSTEL